MLRKTLTILSLIGLLLSVGLWGVSYSGIDRVWRSLETVHGETIHTIHGLVLRDGAVGLFAVGWGSSTNYIDPVRGYCLHTVWMPQGSFYSRNAYGVLIPFWLITMVFGMMLCLCHPLSHHRCRKRKKLGLCLSCGYDIRASKDRCPECGQASAKRSLDESESIGGINEKGE